MDVVIPLIFAGLMAFAMLLYVVLNGYDLGVGMLLPLADDAQKDRMISSIGPFWDANETWLVLGVGILLIAFPRAHGVILNALYMPVCIMLCGLILRGVAFDFRYKVKALHKTLWNHAFFAGSLIASLAQGYMLGRYITGFDSSLAASLFALLTAACMAAGYGLLGATWLIIRTEHQIQRKAFVWARRCLALTALGVIAVSATTPLVSERVLERWFALPELLYIAPIPLATVAAFALCYRQLTTRRPFGGWAPFAASVLIFVLSFIGLAYSLFPYLVPDRIDIWQAASATGSLMFVLYGIGITMPAILAYTIYSYRVFWGKATDLSYE